MQTGWSVSIRVGVLGPGRGSPPLEGGEQEWCILTGSPLPIFILSSVYIEENKPVREVSFLKSLMIVNTHSPFHVCVCLCARLINSFVNVCPLREPVCLSSFAIVLAYAFGAADTVPGLPTDVALLGTPHSQPHIACLVTLVVLVPCQYDYCPTFSWIQE